MNVRLTQPRRGTCCGTRIATHVTAHLSDVDVVDDEAEHGCVLIHVGATGTCAHNGTQRTTQASSGVSLKRRRILLIVSVSPHLLCSDPGLTPECLFLVSCVSIQAEPNKRHPSFLPLPVVSGAPSCNWQSELFFYELFLHGMTFLFRIHCS